MAFHWSTVVIADCKVVSGVDQKIVGAPVVAVVVYDLRASLFNGSTSTQWHHIEAICAHKGDQLWLCGLISYLCLVDVRRKRKAKSKNGSMIDVAVFKHLSVM
jgi:hypothetical protein